MPVKTITKIVSQDYLMKQVKRLRSVGKTFCLVPGYFKIYTPSHVSVLDESTFLADVVVVAVVRSEISKTEFYPASHEGVHYVVCLSSEEELIELALQISPEVMVFVYHPFRKSDRKIRFYYLDNIRKKVKDQTDQIKLVGLPFNGYDDFNQISNFIAGSYLTQEDMANFLF